jgi:hypothetical protein
VFNAWFQPVALPGSGETFKRWGLVERLGHWRGYWDPDPFQFSLFLSLFFFTFWPPWGGLLPLPHTPPWCTVSPQAQSDRVKWQCTATSETMSQRNHFPLLSWLFQVFRHSEGKLIHTGG